MPQIEELHTSSKAAAPGWSYVVDTGYDPSKAAINPTNRKRIRTQGPEAISAGDLTLRQHTAIQKHLVDLARDNKGEAIPVPKSKLDPSGSKKQTTNVKRILTSGKTFEYYVEEEEALLLVKGGGVVADTSTATTADGQKILKPAQRASKTPIARRKSVLANATAISSTESSPAPQIPQGTTRVPSLPTQSQVTNVPPRPHGLAPDTLLVPRAPLGISDEEMEALASGPALTYAAARSAPPPSSAPPRRVFCEICGYWGRVKCMKCGARVCGLECRTAHDESRCLKFYA